MAQMIAAGTQHSLILTRSGLVYAMGDNSNNQLGIPSRRSADSPICVQEINHIPMCYVAAGNFSASVSTENKSLYLWGSGTFGELETPHRVKKVPDPIKTVSIGGDFGAVLTETQQVYTWGDNPQGQLGTGDFVDCGTPKAVPNVVKDGRAISKVVCGQSSLFCLGQNKDISGKVFESTLLHSKIAGMQQAIQKAEKAKLKANTSNISGDSKKSKKTKRKPLSGPSKTVPVPFMIRKSIQKEESFGGAVAAANAAVAAEAAE